MGIILDGKCGIEEDRLYKGGASEIEEDELFVVWSGGDFAGNRKLMDIDDGRGDLERKWSA